MTHTGPSHAAPATDSPPRPWTLWALSLAIVLTGAYNLLLALDHAWQADHYRRLGVSYPPELRAGVALLWGAILAGLGIGLAWRRRWARRWLIVVLSNYGAFGVLWLYGYAASDFGRGRIPFQAGLTVALVALAAWIMRWRRIRRAFEPPDLPAPAPNRPAQHR